MSYPTLRKKDGFSAQRPSLLITLRLVDKQGFPLDESVAWEALNKAFMTHPYYSIEQAEIRPDTQENMTK